MDGNGQLDHSEPRPEVPSRSRHRRDHLRAKLIGELGQIGFLKGADVGGRWGTSHIDLLRSDNNDFYFRRQGINRGVSFGMHVGWEAPMGGWILFGGARAEYSYDYMNIAPPRKSDVQDVNVLLTAGIRF